MQVGRMTCQGWCSRQSRQSQQSLGRQNAHWRPQTGEVLAHAAVWRSLVTQPEVLGVPSGMHAAYVPMHEVVDGSCS